MGQPSPQYGVPLSVANIPLELPLYPIYGVTPSDQYIPIQVNNDGQLSISGVTITGPVTVNDVVIKGVDPANGNTSEDVAVYNLGRDNGYSLRTSIFDGPNHLAINSDGSININPTEVIPVQIDHNTDSVTIYGTVDQGLPNTGGSLSWPVKLYGVNDATGVVQAATINNEFGGINVTSTNFGIPGSAFNQFGEVMAPPGIETAIITYVVTPPIVTAFDIINVIGWGDYDGEFLIRIDGILKGGGRSSAAERTIFLPYDLGPIIAHAGQVITVTITHYAPSSRTFRANLMGGVHD